MPHHLDSVKQTFSQTGFDCIGFSETWLSDSFTNSAIKFDDYTIMRHDRPTRGGGIALFSRPCYKPKIVKVSEHGSTEYLFCRLLVGGASVLVGVVYKAPCGSDGSRTGYPIQTLPVRIPR